MRVVDHDTVSIGRHADPREVLSVRFEGRSGGEGGRRVVMAFKGTTSSNEGDAGDAVAGGEGEEEEEERRKRGQGRCER